MRLNKDWQVLVLACVLSLAASTELLFLDLQGLGRLHFYYLPALLVSLLLGSFERRMRYDHVLILGLVCLLSISALTSFAPVKSLAFVGRAYLAYFCLAGSIAALASVGLAAAVRGIEWSMRIQIVCAAIMLLTGMQPMSINGNSYLSEGRGHFFYYEPSYASFSWVFLASAIAARCVTGISNTRALGLLGLDLLLIILALLVTKSASLVVASILAFGVALVILRAWRAIASIAVISSVPLCALALMCIGNDPRSFVTTGSDNLLIRTATDLIAAEDKLAYLKERGGNRYVRALGAAESFRLNPVLGVGPGNFQEYSEKIVLDGFSRRELEKQLWGLPPVSLWLGFAAESGVVGLLGWLSFFIVIVVASWRNAVVLSRNGIPSFVVFTPVIAVVAQLLLLCGAGGAFRPYVWVNIGLCIAVCRIGHMNADEAVGN